METVSLTLNVSSLRYQDVNGRQFAIAPIKVLQVQVLEGSKGKLFYPPEEIEKNYQAWDGMPLVVYHPNKDGLNISARNPEVMQKQEIGRIYNSRIDGDHNLYVEGWFDVELTQKVDSRVWNDLTNGKKIEVSTGLFTDNEPAALNSEYKGKPYTHVARNYRPDHIAILPDQVGACSVKDGCGVFNAKAQYPEVCPYCGVKLEIDPDSGVCNQCGKKVEPTKETETKPSDTDKRTNNNTYSGIVSSPRDYSDSNTLIPNENTMDRLKSVEWLVSNCDCYKKNTGAKDNLLKMTAEQYADVFSTNAAVTIENEDSKFFDWMQNASDDIKGSVVKMIKNKVVKSMAEKKKALEDDDEEDVKPDTKNKSKGKTDNDDDKTKDKKKVSTNAQIEQTEEEYFATLPPSLRETINNAKKITENEKSRLVGILTQHITDNSKSKAVALLMSKSLPDLQERVLLMPPVTQPVDNKTGSLNVPYGGNDFYAPQGPVDNSGYDVSKDILDTPVVNWTDEQKILNGTR